jgi:putative N6-adenine-specific DNA methylase
VKKAVVERLKSVYRCDWFDETGPAYGIEVSLLNDRATLTLDTSGEALHRRGYRTLVGAAPLRETLAAALVLLSYWNRDRPLVDPFCGSGTIPIEAALIGRNIAPGLNRTFAAERWPQLPTSHWDAARQEARDLARPALPIKIIGNDADERVLSLARQHAVAAGVAEDIHFQQKPLAEFSSARKYGCIISNPPYGERLGEQREVEALYRTMGRVFAPLDTWSIYVLTSHAEFERLYGRRADRRRKLYNSNIACTYYQFYGPKPPKP